MDDQAASALTFVYRNWRGDLAERTVTSPSLWWGTTSYHSRPQWFLKAWDVHKGEERDFAVADIITPMKPA